MIVPNHNFFLSNIDDIHTKSREILRSRSGTVPLKVSKIVIFVYFDKILCVF